MEGERSQDNGPMERAHKIARAVLFALVLLLVLSFSIHKIESRDFGWLLKTGEFIYENHEAPKTELFSFTAEGNAYIDSHWLFQLLLYVSYRVGGIAGATIFGAIILLIAFGAVYLLGYDKEKYVVAPALVVVAAVMASERFLLRPHLITILFLAVYFLILEKHRKSGGWAILLLPCFQLLWVNMHGLFVLGLILPALYIASGLIEKKVRLPWVHKEEGLGANYFKPLGVIMGIMVFESFLSPYTIDVALYPLTLFKEAQSGSNIVAGSVSELSPPLRGVDFSRAVRYFKWMVYLLPITFVLNWRRLNLTHLLLFGAFLYLGLIARRNLDLFAVVAIPIGARNLAGFLHDLPRYFRRAAFPRSLGVVQPALALLMAAGIALMIFRVATDRYFIRDRDLTRFGFGIAKHAHPVKAANFIAGAGLGGRMFNDPSIGGYLIWRFFPERRVYFDGRWEVYGDEFFENFKQFCSDPSLLDKRAEAMEIGYALFPHSRGHLRRLIKHMLKSPDWALVYLDEVSVVFARSTPENMEIIRKFGIDPAAFESERDEYIAGMPPGIEDSHYAGAGGIAARLTERIPRLEYPFEELARANFYFDYGYHENAQKLYERALGVYPDSAMAHDRLGRIYMKQKQYPRALSEFGEVERLSPRSAPNLINLGHLNMAVGRMDRAEKYFGKARKLKPDDADVRLQLGRIYLFKEENEMAVRELRRALELDPDLEVARNLLAQIE